MSGHEHPLLVGLLLTLLHLATGRPAPSAIGQATDQQLLALAESNVGVPWFPDVGEETAFFKIQDIDDFESSQAGVIAGIPKAEDLFEAANVTVATSTLPVYHNIGGVPKPATNNRDDDRYIPLPEESYIHEMHPWPDSSGSTLPPSAITKDKWGFLPQPKRLTEPQDVPWPVPAADSTTKPNTKRKPALAPGGAKRFKAATAMMDAAARRLEPAPSSTTKEKPKATHAATRWRTAPSKPRSPVQTTRFTALASTKSAAVAKTSTKSVDVTKLGGVIKRTASSAVVQQ